jgi:hypothetical protein
MVEVPNSEIEDRMERHFIVLDFVLLDHVVRDNEPGIKVPT